MMRLGIVICVASAALAAGHLDGADAVRTTGSAFTDSVTVDTVVPGVIHRHLTLGEGPWSVQVLEVDLRRPGLSLRLAHAHDQLRGRETVSSIARRWSDSLDVVAGINADFFNLDNGEDENNQVLEGAVWKALPVTDAPQDTSHHVHTQFGLTRDGRPVMARFTLRGGVLAHGSAPWPLAAVNAWPDSNGAAVYTAVLGQFTPADSVGRHPDGIPLRVEGRDGDTMLVRVMGAPQRGGVVTLAGGAVLAVGGGSRTPIERVVVPGARLRVATELWSSIGPLQLVVGGWPRLVVHGISIADSVDRLEGTFPSFSVTRHPRTGIGISRDSNTLYLLTVDGRQESSSGMSLAEFAAVMLRVGVYEGLNLDGGGSTAMVIEHRLANHPSDKEGERAIGNALLVVRRAHE